MSRLHQVKIVVSSDLKERTRELAWLRRTTMSALVVGVLEDYVGGEEDLASDVDSQTVDISVRVDVALWEAAGEKAALEQVSIASIVRRGLRQLTLNVSVP